MISTGVGLNLVVETQYSLFGDWSSFALVYSLRKFLPDCKVYVKINRVDHEIKQLFTWLQKLKVEPIRNLTEAIAVKSTIIMVRPIDEKDLAVIKGEQSLDGFCSDAGGNNFTPFLSFASGCGNFVTSEWINKDDYPFPYADYFVSKDASINEIDIIKLWKQVNQSYSFLLRGA